VQTNAKLSTKVIRDYSPDYQVNPDQDKATHQSNNDVNKAKTDRKINT